MKSSNHLTRVLFWYIFLKKIIFKNKNSYTNIRTFYTKKQNLPYILKNIFEN